MIEDLFVIKGNLKVYKGDEERKKRKKKKENNKGMFSCMGSSVF